MTSLLPLSRGHCLEREQVVSGVSIAGGLQCGEDESSVFPLLAVIERRTWGLPGLACPAFRMAQRRPQRRRCTPVRRPVCRSATVSLVSIGITHTQLRLLAICQASEVTTPNSRWHEWTSCKVDADKMAVIEAISKATWAAGPREGGRWPVSRRCSLGVAKETVTRAGVSGRRRASRQATGGSGSDSWCQEIFGIGHQDALQTCQDD